jgi:hypothetical protein
MSPDTSPHTPSPWQPGDEPDLDRTVAYRVPRAAANEAHTVRLPSWTEPEEIGSATVPGPPAPPQGRGGRGRGWILALVAAVLVGVVGGGGVWAASKLSGGGAQPQDVLPASAMAYVRLDLDPSAGQKLALFGIARKFSATRDSFGGDDPRKALVTALQKDEPDLSKIDYARDVEPWLGDRVGLAVLPADGGGDPVGALAVQVKDEAAARAGIAKMGLGGGKGGLAFREGYAVIAMSQKLADEYVKAAPLSGEPRFAADLDALGEQGVLSFWMDVEKVADAGWSEVAATPVLQQIRGMRFAGALRFSGDYAELAGITRGGTAVPASCPPPRSRRPRSPAWATCCASSGRPSNRVRAARAARRSGRPSTRRGRSTACPCRTTSRRCWAAPSRSLWTSGTSTARSPGWAPCSRRTPPRRATWWTGSRAT